MFGRGGRCGHDGEEDGHAQAAGAGAAAPAGDGGARGGASVGAEPEYGEALSRGPDGSGGVAGRPGGYSGAGGAEGCGLEALATRGARISSNRAWSAAGSELPGCTRMDSAPRQSTTAFEAKTPTFGA